MSDTPSPKGKIPSVLIEEAPAAFAPLAKKHNALAKIIAALSGAKGIKVTVSENNIVIEGQSNGTIDVVGSDGTLNAVPKSSTWVTPTTTSFPTHLQVGASTAARALINDNEVSVVNAAGTAYAALLQNEIILETGSFTLSIAAADLDRDISIRTIDVCDSGTPKLMDIIGSAPYT